MSYADPKLCPLGGLVIAQNEGHNSEIKNIIDLYMSPIKIWYS